MGPACLLSTLVGLLSRLRHPTNRFLDLLAILRSGTDNQPAVPFFPNQSRSSNLHLMVQVLCLLFQHSNRKITQYYQNTLLDCDRKVHDFVSAPLGDSGETNARLGEGENLGLELNGALRDMIIMMHVVGLQLQTLEDLQGIFRNSWKTYDADKGYDGNVVRIPFRFEKKECVTLILRVLGEAMEERRRFKMAFEEWMRWGQSLTDYLEKHLGEAAAAVEAQKQQAKIQEQITAAAAEAQEQQARIQEQITAAAAEAQEQQARIQGQIMAAAAEAREQRARIQEQILAINQQAQMINWFTAVTVLFLPLSFFTSYFRIDWSKGVFPRNGGDFWKLSAPLTFVFMCVTSYVIFRRKVGAGEIIMEVKLYEESEGKCEWSRRRASRNRRQMDRVVGGGELAVRNMS